MFHVFQIIFNFKKFQNNRMIWTFRCFNLLNYYQYFKIKMSYSTPTIVDVN